MNKQQVQIVIDNFKKVLPMAIEENHLDMQNPFVNSGNHTCGTTHCHGGWYAIAVFNTKLKKVNYHDGAAMIAEHLGFANEGFLEEWAYNHPVTWGNLNGNEMFTDAIAFESRTRPKGAQNLQDIIDHWEEVKNRLSN